MAVSKLVDPKIKHKQSDQLTLPQSTSCNNTTVQDYAIAFVKSLEPEKRIKFKRMIQAGIKWGESIATLYNIPLDEFKKEVEAII